MGDEHDGVLPPTMQEYMSAVGGALSRKNNNSKDTEYKTNPTE
jgi:hypothetical protein